MIAVRGHLHSVVSCSSDAFASCPHASTPPRRPGRGAASHQTSIEHVVRVRHRSCFSHDAEVHDNRRLRGHVSGRPRPSQPAAAASRGDDRHRSVSKPVSGCRPRCWQAPPWIPPAPYGGDVPDALLASRAESRTGRHEAALGAGVLRYALGASPQVAARAPARRDRDPATPDDVSGQSVPPPRLGRAQPD